MYHLTTLLIFAASVLAAPTAQDTTHIYVCTDASFKGLCRNIQIETSKCHKFSDDLKSKISSAGPDNGTFCSLFRSSNCKGGALPFAYPGIKSLGRYGFDDVAQSVRCDVIAGWKDHP